MMNKEIYLAYGCKIDKTTVQKWYTNSTKVHKFNSGRDRE